MRVTSRICVLSFEGDGEPAQHLAHFIDIEKRGKGVGISLSELSNVESLNDILNGYDRRHWEFKPASDDHIKYISTWAAKHASEHLFTTVTFDL